MPLERAGEMMKKSSVVEHLDSGVPGCQRQDGDGNEND